MWPGFAAAPLAPVMISVAVCEVPDVLYGHRGLRTSQLSLDAGLTLLRPDSSLHNSFARSATNGHL